MDTPPLAVPDEGPDHGAAGGEPASATAGHDHVAVVTGVTEVVDVAEVIEVSAATGEIEVTEIVEVTEVVEFVDVDLDAMAADLDAVDAALRRLDDGTYGTCEVCAATLADADLVADPVLRRCPEHRSTGTPAVTPPASDAAGN